MITCSIMAQTVQNTEDFLRLYENDLRNITQLTHGQELGKKAVAAIGVTNKVKGFLKLIPTSMRYTRVVDYIESQRTITRGALQVTYTKVATSYQVHRSSDQLTAISNALTNLGRAASVYTIIDAVGRMEQGDEKANREAMAATYGLLSSELLFHYGLGHIKLAVLPIESSLYTFLSSTLQTNENLVYEAYKDYLNSKYTKDDWWQLYVAKDFGRIQANLVDDFWSGGYSDLIVEEYKQRQNIRRNVAIVIDRTGRLAADQNAKMRFAKRYYQNELNNDIVIKKGAALIQDRMRMQGIMIGELHTAMELKEKAEELLAELERIEIEMNQKIQFDEKDVDFIKIIPQDKRITKGDIVNFEVRAYLKNEKSTFITEECDVPTVDSQTAGLKNISVVYKGFSDETTLSVEVEPDLEIVPKEYRFNINEMNKSVAFRVLFTDKYEQSSDVTDVAFEGNIVHPNFDDYTNAREYPIDADYRLEGKIYRDQAVVIVSGCEDPDRVLDASGDCICDESRGLYENDEDACSKYINIRLQPKHVSAEVGAGYSIEVIGYDGDGNESVIYKINDYVKDESRETIGISYEGYYDTYTVQGLACPDERMEVDAKGNCQCRSEFIPNGDQCLTVEEIEEQARQDGAGKDVDCDAVVREAREQYNKHANFIVPNIQSFQEHAQLALKLLNDRLSDPCNNAAFANSMDIAQKIDDDLMIMHQGLRGGMAELWGNGGYACPELVLIESDLLDPLFSELNNVHDVQQFLESKWLEFNCKQEEIDDLSPALVTDPSRNPTGNVLGGAGYDFPGAGFDNDGDGFTQGMFNPPPGGGSTGSGNDQLEICLQSKGLSLNTLQTTQQQLVTALQQSGLAWSDNGEMSSILCRELKQDYQDYRDFQINLRDCLIQADIQNQPNGQQWLDGTNSLIQVMNTEIQELPC